MENSRVSVGGTISLIYDNIEDFHQVLEAIYWPPLALSSAR